MQQPMSLRMPLVFEGSRAFSQDEVVTQTRALSPGFNDETTLKGSERSPCVSPPPQSPPLPIMQFDEPSYFSNFHAGTTETVITATPSGSDTQTATWYMTSLPYELDMDLYLQHAFSPRRTHECLEKAQSKFSKKPPGEKLQQEYKGSAFEKVALFVTPNTTSTSKPDDLVPLDYRHLAEIVGEAGLAGYFKSTKKYVETHFRIRDVSAAGRGRFVAFGKVKRGTFRGSRPGSGDDVGASTPLGGRPDSAMDEPFYQPEEATRTPQFEALRGRVDMMGLR